MTEIIEKPITIKIDDLVKIFQVTDPSLYQRPDGEEYEMRLSKALLTMKLMRSAALKELEQSDVSENSLDVFVSSASTIFAFRTFSVARNNDELDFVSMTIAQMVDISEEDQSQGKEKYALSPIFTFTGQMTDDAVIIVREAIARLPDDEKTCNFADATCPEDFIAMMVYADACFTMALKGKPINPDQIGTLLSSNAISAAGPKFQELCDRTKFDANIIRFGHKPTDILSTLAISDFENALQIRNPNIYKAIPKDEEKDLHQNVLTFLKDLGSAYAAHFEEGVEFTSPPIVMQNRNGDFIWSHYYCLKDSFGVMRDYHLLIVGTGGENSENDEEKIVRPIAVIIGEIDYFRKEYETLEAICVVHKPTADGTEANIYLSLKTPDGALASICYAESAMQTILLQRPLDTKILSALFEKNDTNAIIERLYHIVHRTDRALTDELLELIDASPSQYERPSAEQPQDPGKMFPGYHLH